MKKTLQLLTSMAVGISLAACGASGNGGTAPSNVAPIAKNVLQFAVGTANLFGTSTALNVVVTYRQPSGSYAPGDSGTLLNIPTLTLPGPLAANSATGSASAVTGYDPLSTVLYTPATSEVGNDAITASSQSPTTATVTSFGQSGGAFGLGIEPFNSIGGGSAAGSGNPSSLGSPFQVAPYPVPLYDAAAATAAGDPNSLIPWGGPPAFDLTGSGGDSVVGNGNYPTGTAGVSEGIDVFEGVAPTAGTYSLSVAVPANTGTVTQTQSFALPAVVTIATPTDPTLTPDGSGGGSFAGFVMPAGATEAYVQVVDYGPADQTATGASSPSQPTGCNGASVAAPIYYTVETTTTPAALGDALAPGGAPSTCTAAANNAVTQGTTYPAAAGADQVVIQVVAFDYPAFESSYPSSLKNPSPTILGSKGSDDIAIAPAACTFVGGASCNANLPLIRKRQMAAAYGHRRI